MKKTFCRLFILVISLICVLNFSTVYADDSNITLTDSSTNITLEATTGVIPDDSELLVETITDGERFDAISSVLDEETFSIFSISVTSLEEPVEPSGNVKITIPIPEDYDKDNLIVYSVNEENEKVECVTTVDVDKISFETTTLGDFVLALKKEEVTKPDDPDTDNPLISIKDDTTNIIIESGKDVIPDNTKLNVSQLINGSRFEEIKSVLQNEKFSIFSITLTSNDQPVQPTGNVTVKIPVPTGYDANNLVVYYVDENNKAEEISVTVKDNYAVFETNHFSDYVLAEKVSNNENNEENVEENTNENTTNTLDNEPKTGFNNPISFVITVLVISCLGLAFCIRKMSK